MSERDPRVDPQPGDVVESRGERARVVSIEREGLDASLGPGPHVHALHDSRCGQRSRCTMSLETWRARASSE